MIIFGFRTSNFHNIFHLVVVASYLFVSCESIQNCSVHKSESMPRKSKKEKTVVEKTNGDEVESKNEPKINNDSNEKVADDEVASKSEPKLEKNSDEEQGDGEVASKQKSKIKKNIKEVAVNPKSKPRKSKKAKDESEPSDDEAFEEKPISKKTDDKDSNKRKRITDDNGEESSPKKVKKELLNKAETDTDTLIVTNTKCTADGKSSNFKIASWNVAGLRAWVKKNGLDYIKKEQADIVCLQETKCSESQLPPGVYVKGYHTYWCSGTKPGYAGVALYSKEKPLNVKYGLGKQEYDAEGRLITAEYEKFYIIAIYVPNAGSGLKNLDRRMQWDKDFKAYLKCLDEKKPVIVCGDMNVSHQPIDLANPKTNTKSAGFTQEERNGMTALLEAGFVDTFRHLYPDRTGAYTYWTYFHNARSRNVGWRLDYFITSKRFVDNVCDNVIRTEVYGSDHCPIVLFANV